MSDIRAKAAVLGNGAAAMAKSSAKMWVEDPQGSLEQARVGLGKVAGGVKNYGSRLSQGDLNAVAGTTGVVFDVAATVATMGGSQVGNAGKMGRVGELMQEVKTALPR